MGYEKECNILIFKISIDFQIQEIFPSAATVLHTHLSVLQLSQEIFPVSESQCELISISQWNKQWK